MGTQNHEKINQIILGWPTGAVRTAATLRAMGVSSSLVRKYVQGGWLAPLGPGSRGAYRRAGDAVDWTGGVYALQEAKRPHIHVGGRTALEMQGYAHYGALGTREVFLHAPGASVLPTWFADHDWGAPIVFTASSQLQGLAWRELVSQPVRDYVVLLSPPEQAALEMLFHVPRRVGFDEAGQIMAGLGTMRPALAQTLLERCGSIRAKRLLLYFAEAFGLAWRADLDLSRIDLGRGNRQIVPGGVLDRQYRITVPAGSADAGGAF
ncbi:MAG: type IV toxin-antitoxin system AbiEi family antitoxin domain-containing protein [Desulfovibrionaceae bacterium]|nr:type IV toxin-antitoxin system AbiEi family antitoxin domain-containing protein [Desulfovibrionaceae bacterium]